MTFLRSASVAAIAFAALAGASYSATAADISVVSQRDVVGTSVTGSDTKVTYGERTSALVTRNVVNVEFGAGGDPVITYGDTVYPVISRTVASVRQDGDGLKVIYQDVDGEAYRQLTQRIQGSGSAD